MNRDEIAARLSAHHADILGFGVASLKLFGSHSRDQARPDSDVDFLVAFDPPVTFDRYMDLKFFLEDVLARRVDLVTEGGLRPELRPHIEQDAVRVA